MHPSSLRPHPSVGVQPALQQPVPDPCDAGRPASGRVAFGGSAGRFARGQIALWQMAVLVAILLVGGLWVSMRVGSPDSDGRTSIVLWNASEFGEEIYAAIHRFELENPQYHVVASSSATADTTSDAQRLLSAVAGGVPPDVVAFDRFAIGEWAARGALTDLRPFIDAQPKGDADNIDLSNFYEWALNEARYRPPGTTDAPGLYGIPTTCDIRMLFANANQLRQAGLTGAGGSPRPPRTWEQLRVAANKLTRTDASGRMTRLGFAPNYGNSWLYIYAFQAGGKLLSDDGTTATLNSPEVVRALAFMTDIYDDLGGAQKVNSFAAGFQAGVLDPFIQGQVSMKIDGDWFMTTIADFAPNMDFTVTPGPMPADRLDRGVKPVTWAGGYSVVIPSTAQHKEGAFKLMRFLLSHRAYQFMEQGSRERRLAQGKFYLPRGNANQTFFEQSIRETIDNSPQLPQPFKDAYAVMRELLPNTKIRPPSPVGQVLWNQHIRAFDAATIHQSQAKTNTQEAKVALTAMQVDVQRQLDRVIAPPPPVKVNWTPYFVGYAFVVVALLAAVWITFKLHRRSHNYSGRELGAAALFASPWVIGMVCLTGGPILFSIVMSFTRYDVLNSARYVGMGNYTDVLADPVFYTSLWNTAYMVVRIPLGMAIGLAIAVLLNRPMRGISAYRTGFYMPAIVPVVASSLLWVYLLNPNFGAVSSTLRWAFDTWLFHGIESGLNAVFTFDAGPFKFTVPAWLQDPAWSKPSIVLMGLWTAGSGMIIWLAGLQSIPRQLYEAATVDGANKWQQFRHVTLPMLSPYVLFNAVIGLIGTFQIFSEAFIMTQGGPADSTLFYAYYLFRQAFQYFRMGYASALAWILFIIVLALTLVQLWLSRRWVHYDRA